MSTLSPHQTLTRNAQQAANCNTSSCWACGLPLAAPADAAAHAASAAAPPGRLLQSTCCVETDGCMSGVPHSVSVCDSLPNMTQHACNCSKPLCAHVLLQQLDSHATTYLQSIPLAPWLYMCIQLGLLLLMKLRQLQARRSTTG
jgi:hypothetical protein